MNEEKPADQSLALWFLSPSRVKCLAVAEALRGVKIELHASPLYGEPAKTVKPKRTRGARPNRKSKLKQRKY